MALDNESFNKQLYDLLKVRGYKPVPKNSRNQNVEASQLADVMEFVFMKDGEEYGKAWASIDDASNVIIYYDEEQADSPEGKTPGVEYDDSWSGFLKHVKNWAQRKQLSFELANKDRLSDDMRQREYVKMKEKISEGYHPMGNKASYNDNVPNIKIILQHNRKIEEGEQRYRNVAKIFLENTEGERILAPTTRPGIAQIYARHLAEGGVPNDERWNHIKGLCEEYSKMAGFVRATRNNQFNESAQALVNEGINHYQSLRETLSKMRGHRGYNTYFESWTPALMENEGEETSLNELFVQETLDPRIESVMPILSRLHNNSGAKPMAEVMELAEWAQSILEGEGGPEASEEQDVLTPGDAGEEMDASAEEEELSETEDSTTKSLAVPADKMLEAPGAETLSHNQSTEKSNLAAFDLDEEASEGRPYIVVHAKKGKTEVHANSSYEAAKKAAQKWGLKSTAGVDAYLADVSHSPASVGEALDPMADKIAELEKQLRTASPEEARKIKELLTLLKAKKDGDKGPRKSSGGTAADKAEQRAKERFTKKSSVTGDDIGSALKGGAALAGFFGLGESRMAEADSIIQDVINGDLDAYDVMNHPKTPEEEYVAKLMQDMYDDVSIDHHLHPDDDFEQILDIVVDRLEQDYGHQEEPIDEVDMGQADRTLRHTPRGDDDGKMSHITSLGKAAKKMGHDSYMDVPDDAVAKLKALAKKIRGGEEVEEGLDANQKRVGQLGPTEPVGKNEKNLRGKLVGASESVEVKEGQDDLDALKRLLNRY